MSAKVDAEVWLDASEGPLFEEYEGDVTPYTRNGALGIVATVDAGDVFEALAFASRIMYFLRRLGYETTSVSVEPDAAVPAQDAV